MFLKSLIFIAIIGICQAEHPYSSQSIVVHHEYKEPEHKHEHKHEHAHEHHHEYKHEPEHKHEHSTPVKAPAPAEKKAEVKKVEQVPAKKEEHVEIKKVEPETQTAEPVPIRKLKSVVHHEISHPHHAPEKVTGPVVTQKAELVAHYIVKGTEHDHKHEHKEEHKKEHKHEHKEEHKQEHKQDHKQEHKQEHKEEHKQEHKHEHNLEHIEKHNQDNKHEHKNEHKQDHKEEHKHEQHAYAYSSQHIIRHDVPAPPPKEHHAPAKYEYNVHDPHTHGKKHHQEAHDDHSVKGVYSLHQGNGSERSVEHPVGKKTGFQAEIIHTTKHVEETKKH